MNVYRLSEQRKSDFDVILFFARFLNLGSLIAVALPVAIQVDNHAGHVWAEAGVGGRWVHIDPCEAAVDEPEQNWVMGASLQAARVVAACRVETRKEPLLYAVQWGRCPQHVLAYQDLGWPMQSQQCVTGPGRNLQDLFFSCS